MTSFLACVVFVALPGASLAASEPAREQGSHGSTKIGSLTVGSGDESATFSDVRSTCNAFRLALAFGSAAGEIRHCLPEQETRRVLLQIEEGRVTTASVDPDDDVGRCVTRALAGAQLDGLTCTLEAGVSR